ncbi:MAG: hypothetical protein ABIE14_00575, partial [Patescibacteria group bacterium]
PCLKNTLTKKSNPPGWNQEPTPNVHFPLSTFHLGVSFYQHDYGIRRGGRESPSIFSNCFSPDPQSSTFQPEGGARSAEGLGSGSTIVESAVADRNLQIFSQTKNPLIRYE